MSDTAGVLEPAAKAAQNDLAFLVTSKPFVLVVAAVAAVVTLACILLAVYLRSYIAKKAEHLATKEQLKDLLVQQRALAETTESVKARIGGGLWLEQERWKLKSALSRSLIESLHEFGLVCRRLDVLRDKEPSDESTEKFDSELASMTKALHTIEGHTKVAALWLSKDTMDALRSLFRDFQEVEPSKDRNDGKALTHTIRGLAAAASDKVVAEATRDLSLNLGKDSQ
jgi:hypothetical protein